MVTSGNLDRLRASRQGYLVGLKRRRPPEILRYLQSATGPWLNVPLGSQPRKNSRRRRLGCRRWLPAERECEYL
jgi:hypothetical protein